MRTLRPAKEIERELRETDWDQVMLGTQTIGIACPLCGAMVPPVVHAANRREQHIQHHVLMTEMLGQR